MEILILCGIYLAELACFGLGLRLLFEVRYKTKVWMIAGMVLPVVIAFLPIRAAGKNFLITAMAMGVMILSSEGKVVEKGFRVIFTFLTLACVDKFFEFLFESLFVADSGYGGNINYLIIKQGTIVSIILMNIVKSKIGKYRRTHINSLIYFVIGMIVILMIFCLGILKQVVIYVPNNVYNILCNVLNIAVYISIFLLIAFIIYIKNTHERMEQLLKTEQLLKEAQVNYYKQILKKESDTRKYRHDMVSHLIYIRDLLEQNRKKDALNYLANILGGFKKIQSTYYVTGSEMVDTIMNYYFGMLPKDVTIEIHGKCPVELALEDTEVCTIFSNVFQNAVEEVLEHKIKDAHILMGITKGRQYVMYDVRNSMHGTIDETAVDKNGLPKTHKPDGRNHGIGLVNVRDSVERNHGKFEWYQADGYFGVKIILPVKN